MEADATLWIDYEGNIPGITIASLGTKGQRRHSRSTKRKTGSSAHYRKRTTSDSG